jgi:TfoX/Sxy family transcriptional regulator of competence genes
VPYDERLAERIRAHLADEPGLGEMRMFGGLAFLIEGNMAIAASGQGGLMVRVDPADAETLIEEPVVTPVVMRERPMKGWMRVDASIVGGEDALREWIERGVAFARSLPPKDRDG